MDMHDAWDYATEKMKLEDFRDLDKLAWAFGRCSDDRVLRKILAEVFDTHDPVEVMDCVACIFECSAQAIELEKDGWNVYAKRRYDGDN